MKNAFITILTLISLTCLGQQWTKYQLDSTLAMELPDNYKVVDTLGQRLISAQVPNGLISVLVIRNEGEMKTNIQTENELLDTYKGFRSGLINAQKGQLVEEKILEKNGLKSIRISYRVTVGNEIQLRHSLGVFVNGKMYAINFIEIESMTKEMAPVREKLFSSLIFPANSSFENQKGGSATDAR
jgi:hypothetical protein